MNKPLNSLLHLHTAAIERRPIVVYFADDELIAEGLIEEMTDRAVKVGGEWHNDEHVLLFRTLRT